MQKAKTYFTCMAGRQRSRDKQEVKTCRQVVRRPRVRLLALGQLIDD